MNYKVGIIGLGFVGSAMKKSFLLKNISLEVYDKYKSGGIGSFDTCLTADIVFLALPTLFDEVLGEYDKSSLIETLELFNNNNYEGAIIIKSTVEPKTVDIFSDKYPSLNLIHNPEFLTARTAFEDFHNQQHIILGKGKYCDNDIYANVLSFYRSLYENSEISECTTIESETMKCFINCFYAIKVQFFSEIYLTCGKNGSDYNIIKNMMLKNGWINPMHTIVPGPDGLISYGGACFPKDTNAMNEYMKKLKIPHGILDATIEERNTMRKK